MLLLEQLSCLEAQTEVEAAGNFERLLEVVGDELGGSDEKLRAVDPRTVDPEDVGHPLLLEDGEPGAEATADVDDAPGRNGGQDQQDGDPCGLRRAGEPALEVDGVER